MKKIIKWKRTGKCNGCGICCIFKDNVRRINKKGGKGEIRFKLKTGYTIIDEIKERVFNKTEVYVCMGRAHACPQLLFDRNGKYRCALHGKKIQPAVCQGFPFTPDHDYYKMVKKFCGYRFVKDGYVKEVKKERKVKSMNMNVFARKITLKEGGKINQSIAQVKETIKLTMTELAKHTDKEILETVHRYKKKK